MVAYTRDRTDDEALFDLRENDRRRYAHRSESWDGGVEYIAASGVRKNVRAGSYEEDDLDRTCEKKGWANG